MPDDPKAHQPLTPAALAPQVPPLARSVIALCAGLFTGGLMIVFVERVGHFAVAPPVLPAGVAAEAQSALAGMRTENFVLLLVAYFVGTTLGCWMAARMARRNARTHAIIVGAVFFLGVVSSLVRYPYPSWFVVASLAAFIAAPFAGARMAGR